MKGKKIFNRRMVFVIISIVIFTLSSSCTSRKGITEISTGNYIEFGKYNNEPILWQVIDIGNNGVMLVSDKILSFKAFDAAEGGNFKGFNDVPDINTLGSNQWENSNIREWLNSSDITVKYSTMPPVADALQMNMNAYDTEPGFLHGFTNDEISYIRDVSNGQGQVQDKVYLLSSSELNLLSNKKKSPCASALKKSDAASPDDSTSTTYDYWLRTPSTEQDYLVTLAPAMDNMFAANGFEGIVPALNLKDNLHIYSGTGTSNDPYKIGK